MPTTTMSALVAAILATLRAHDWPAPINQIGFRQPDLEPFSDDDQPTRLDTPALLLHIVDRRDASADPDTLIVPGRVARRCSFELHCLLSTSTPNLPLELIEYSESALALIDARESASSPGRGNRWGLLDAVEFPAGLTDSDATYASAWHGHAARVLSWEQIVYLPEAPRP